MKYEIGKTYKVQFNDCCVEGDFVAKLIEYNEDSSTYAFENGVRLFGHAVVLKESEANVTYIRRIELDELLPGTEEHRRKYGY